MLAAVVSPFSLWALIAAFVLIRDEFIQPKNVEHWRLISLAHAWPWWGWVIATLMLMMAVLLEGTFRYAHPPTSDDEPRLADAIPSEGVTILDGRKRRMEALEEEKLRLEVERLKAQPMKEALEEARSRPGPIGRLARSGHIRPAQSVTATDLFDEQLRREELNLKAREIEVRQTALAPPVVECIAVRANDCVVVPFEGGFREWSAGIGGLSLRDMSSAFVAVFRHESGPSVEVARARIEYFDESGRSVVTVKYGCWLGESLHETEFVPGDTRELLMTVFERQQAVAIDDNRSDASRPTGHTPRQLPNGALRVKATLLLMDGNYNETGRREEWFQITLDDNETPDIRRSARLETAKS